MPLPDLTIAYFILSIEIPEPVSVTLLKHICGFFSLVHLFVIIFPEESFSSSFPISGLVVSIYTCKLLIVLIFPDLSMALNPILYDLEPLNFDAGIVYFEFDIAVFPTEE